jgi:hypothetical protein
VVSASTSTTPTTGVVSAPTTASAALWKASGTSGRNRSGPIATSGSAMIPNTSATA